MCDDQIHCVSGLDAKKKVSNWKMSMHLCEQDFLSAPQTTIKEHFDLVYASFIGLVKLGSQQNPNDN